MLYDLTTLQREANARFGLTAAKTLEAAQACTKRTSFDLSAHGQPPPADDQRPVVKALLQKMPEELLSLLKQDFREPGKRVFDNDKISDHHAIIPTGRTPGRALSQAEQQIFDLVQRRLCAAFLGDYTYEQCQVRTQVSGHMFVSRGKTLLSPGWQKAAPPLKTKKDEQDEDAPLPPLKEGESYPVKSASGKKADAPARPVHGKHPAGRHGARGPLVTDEALRAQLKERGLGTPATRAATLERLIEVATYAACAKACWPRKRGKRLIEAVPWQLSSPETTGRWEKGLKDIENGKMDPERFMQSIRRYSAYLVEAAKSAPGIAFPPDEKPPARKKRASTPRKATRKKGRRLRLLTQTSLLQARPSFAIKSHKGACIAPACQPFLQEDTPCFILNRPPSFARAACPPHRAGRRHFFCCRLSRRLSSCTPAARSGFDSFVPAGAVCFHPVLRSLRIALSFLQPLFARRAGGTQPRIFRRFLREESGALRDGVQCRTLYFSDENSADGEDRLCYLDAERNMLIVTGGRYTITAQGQSNIGIRRRKAKLRLPLRKEESPLAKQSRVMVCVTGQLTCERLIRAGAQLAQKEAAELSVVHVARMNQNVLGNPLEGEALEYLFSLSREFGADMTLLRDDNVLSALVNHAKKIGATHVVMGVSDRKGADFSYALQASLPHVQVFAEHNLAQGN